MPSLLSTRCVPTFELNAVTTSISQLKGTSTDNCNLEKESQYLHPGSTKDVPRRCGNLTHTIMVLIKSKPWSQRDVSAVKNTCHYGGGPGFGSQHHGHRQGIQCPLLTSVSTMHAHSIMMMMMMMILINNNNNNNNNNNIIFPENVST